MSSSLQYYRLSLCCLRSLLGRELPACAQIQPYKCACVCVRRKGRADHPSQCNTSAMHFKSKQCLQEKTYFSAFSRAARARASSLSAFARILFAWMSYLGSLYGSTYSTSSCGRVQAESAGPVGRQQSNDLTLCNAGARRGAKSGQIVVHINISATTHHIIGT